MRLAVNAANLRGLGSGSVGRNILGELPRAMCGGFLRAWVPSGWEELEDGGRISARESRAGPGALRKLWLENVSLRRSISSDKVDVLFSLGDTSMPRCPVPHLLLVQTPYLAYGPEDRDFRIPWSFRAKIRLIERYFEMGLSTVTRLTVQSVHMKRRIAKRWALDQDRIVVIPSAVEEAPVAQVKRGPFIFYPATASPHKNHVVLADTMQKLKGVRSGVACILTVLPSEVPELVARARERGVLDQFVFAGKISTERARGMMAASVAVVLPAKLETFGLPYYEALSVGGVIVAADRECAREACGPAASYADADSGEAFAQRIAEIIEDESMANNMRRLAIDRFRAVGRTWRSVAAEYVACLREILQSGVAR